MSQLQCMWDIKPPDEMASFLIEIYQERALCKVLRRLQANINCNAISNIEYGHMIANVIAQNLLLEMIPHDGTSKKPLF